MSRYYRSFLEESTLPSTLWNNLLAYYTADNTPNDSKGTNNATLINGATYATGKINNGFSFDGVNDYLGFVSNWFRKSKTEPFTFSFWIYIPSNNVYTVFSNGADDGHWAFVISRKIAFQIGASGSSYLRVYSTSTIPSNTFKHITISYDGSASPSGFKIYIDGFSDIVITVSDTLGANNTPAIASIPNIGRRPSGNEYFFNGKIDELGIWDRVLTQTEVTELYNSGSGKQYPL